MPSATRWDKAPFPPVFTIERDAEELRFWANRKADAGAVHAVSRRNSYRVIRPFAIHQWKVEPDGKTEAFAADGPTAEQVSPEPGWLTPLYAPSRKQ